MRCLLALAFLVGCGSTVRTPPPPTDDLELDESQTRRVDDAPPVEGETFAIAGTDGGVAGEPAVSVRVVDEAPADDRGPRIDLAVRDADVADVLRMIAAAAKIGLVVSDDVKATVTLEVRHVTWRQAIDVIAQLEGLEVVEERGIVTVTRSAR
jgi:type II secretory pathway component HofQ